MNKLLWILIASAFSISSSEAQIKGCTDKLANNYSPQAEVNDGSCLYNSSSYQPITVGRPLSDTIVETSGLIYFNGMFWTINDSNNPPFLYAFDSISGIIKHQTYIDQAMNNDWEDLSQDSMYIYIGDFGNNRGDRKDLHILKIKKSDIRLKNFSDTVPFQKIRFEMQDQINFNNSGQNHDYDLEAFCVIGDSLHLFSKNWVDAKTRHYVCPKDSGYYRLMPVETLNPGGQITGAAYRQGILVLTGYNKGNYGSFIYLCWDYSQERFLSGNRRRIEIGNLLSPGQNEGICFKDRVLYLSNEKQITAAQLHRLHVHAWLPDALGLLKNQEKITDRFKFILQKHKLEITLLKPALKETITIRDASGREIAVKKLNQSGAHIDLSGHATGIYYVFSGEQLVYKFFLE